MASTPSTRGRARSRSIVATKPDQLAQRNREIGTLLADARQQQRRSVSECAALLGTSRRRYRAIERGDIGVEAAELELLVAYLDVPLQAIWKERERQAVHRVVRLGPGEVVQVMAEATASTGG